MLLSWWLTVVVSSGAQVLLLVTVASGLACNGAMDSLRSSIVGLDLA